MFHDAPKQVMKTTYDMSFKNMFDKQNITIEMPDDYRIIVRTIKDNNPFNSEEGVEVS